MAKLTERFPATVTSIEDEDSDPQRGRIKVACAGLLGDEESELPMWVEPALDWGHFYIPDVGEIVEVEVVAGTEQDEHIGQSSIDNLDIRWRGKRFYTTGEGTVGEQDQDPEVDARLVHAEFLDPNYGKRRGFATPWGHIVFFDDTDGDHRIVVMHSAEQLPHGEPFEDATKYTRVEIEPDGSIKAHLIGKHQFHLQTDPDGEGIVELNMTYDEPDGTPKHTIKLDANTPELKITLAEEEHIVHLDGSVPKLEATLASANSGILLDDAAELFDAFVAAGDGAIRLDNTVPSLEVALGGGAGALIDQPDGDTVTTLGDGAEQAMIASEMEAWLNDTYTPAIADMHDNHVHPLNQYIAPLIPLSAVPCLPGGPPSPDVPVVPASLEDYDSAITSEKLYFPAN